MTSASVRPSLKGGPHDAKQIFTARAGLSRERHSMAHALTPFPRRPLLLNVVINHLFGIGRVFFRHIFLFDGSLLASADERAMPNWTQVLFVRRPEVCIGALP
jgi:hypothetical protein